MSEREQTVGASRLAALDLGSNSFHLLVAEVNAQGWRPLKRLGEKVQLAAGLEAGQLNPAAIARGLDCLARFAPDLQTLPASAVRIVCTHTLRVALNRELFIAPAEQLLGHPLQVISGEEEATLIYRGVADPASTKPQLVIDVGGGSTELALGAGSALWQLASAPLGCVTYRRYFPQQSLNATYFEQAYTNACAELRRHWQRALGPDVQVLGSSGTLQAVAMVVQQQGWCASGIDRQSLQKLRRALLDFTHLDAVQFPGLSETRRGVFATGAAIVMALFDTLGIDSMTLSQAALREGVIAQLCHEQHLVAAPAL